MYSTRISSFALLKTENTIINSRLFRTENWAERKINVWCRFSFCHMKNVGKKNHETTTTKSKLVSRLHAKWSNVFTAVVKCVRNNLFSSQFSYFVKTAWLCLVIGNKHSSSLQKFSFLAYNQTNQRLSRGSETEISMSKIFSGIEYLQTERERARENSFDIKRGSRFRTHEDTVKYFVNRKSKSKKTKMLGGKR